MDHPITSLKRRIRTLLIFFMFALILSGVTAFPIVFELTLIQRWMTTYHWEGTIFNWLAYAIPAVQETYTNYPFIAYGTDWLAFAHIVIAVVFIGPFRDPVRNIWVLQFGMIACVMVFPLAFIAGSIREIPFMWQLMDCSFGVVGIIMLYIGYRWTKELEALTRSQIEDYRSNPKN